MTKFRQNVVYWFSIFHGEVITPNLDLPSGYDDFTDSSNAIKPLEIFPINNNQSYSPGRVVFQAKSPLHVLNKSILQMSEDVLQFLNCRNDMLLGKDETLRGP